MCHSHTVVIKRELPSLSSMDTVANAGDTETPRSEGEESWMVKVSSSPSTSESSLIGMLVH